MRLAIMQPYLFPYFGYFQLIHSVDMFVVYDDVSFIKGGWVNRNYVLGQNGKQLMTLPLIRASQNKCINEIDIGENHKILKMLVHSYSKAPYFKDVFPMIEGIVLQSTGNLGGFLSKQLLRICHYLGLDPKWYLSSNLRKDNQLRGQDKILAICAELGATQYINLPSGVALYDQKTFERHGVKLSFIQPRALSYKQFGTEFIRNLSIIDVLMFNSRRECARLLGQYDLA